MRTCFFIGHRDSPSSIQEKINYEVRRLAAKCGVTEFVVGHYGNFDTMATIAVQKVKEANPELYAYRLLAYPPIDKRPIIPAFFDDLYYPLDLLKTPKRFAITKAYRLMIDEADYLITYVHRDGGNSGAFMRHARVRERKGFLKIINIPME